MTRGIAVPKTITRPDIDSPVELCASSSAKSISEKLLKSVVEAAVTVNRRFVRFKEL